MHKCIMILIDHNNSIILLSPSPILSHVLGNLWIFCSLRFYICFVLIHFFSLSLWFRSHFMFSLLMIQLMTFSNVLWVVKYWQNLWCLDSFSIANIVFNLQTTPFIRSAVIHIAIYLIWCDLCSAIASFLCGTNVQLVVRFYNTKTFLHFLIPHC